MLFSAANQGFPIVEPRSFSFFVSLWELWYRKHCRLLRGKFDCRTRGGVGRANLWLTTLFAPSPEAILKVNQNLVFKLSKTLHNIQTSLLKCPYKIPSRATMRYNLLAAALVAETVVAYPFMGTESIPNAEREKRQTQSTHYACRRDLPKQLKSRSSCSAV